MEIRPPVHPEHGKTFDTEKMRKEFLITDLFNPDETKYTYSHIDRIIIGGIMPVKKALTVPEGNKLGTAFFLERREMGVINIGGPGKISLDGKEHSLGNEDGLYAGTGTKEVLFTSDDPSNPALFYMTSSPAHHKFPDVKIAIKEASPLPLGDQSTANARTIYKYLHPDVMETCQLSMGLTKLEPGSVWNTMPAHTHDRRMEVYFYLNVPEKNVVFHLMGEPQEARILTMRNHEAVINPSWSIHSGVGTTNYSFIWAMCGENIAFDDMDFIDMDDIK